MSDPNGDPIYRRVIVKLSGEALNGDKPFGIDQATVERIAADLAATAGLGVELGVVVGGGNIFRGVEVSERGVPRPVGDTMGMLATVMNCLVLEAAIERQGCEARTLSALSMTSVCETYNRKRAMKNLAKGRVVLLAAGTGNPFFTTDTTAVLRAAELECQAVLKATNVDGVYTADPKKDPSAVRYERLTHQEAIEKDLRVMDGAAFALARENRTPIIVFSIADRNAIETVLRGQGRTTVVG
ncbi:MAG: UMP kinase [Rhodopseudomonas sp.]|nr:UMP kinase [Rhodopseudomonas sp.]